MADKPRLLVIDRDTGSEPDARRDLAATHDLVVTRSLARAVALLREQPFDGVYVPANQLGTVRSAASLLQADEILEAIADGVAVVAPEDLRIVWANPEFRLLVSDPVDPVGRPFAEVLVPDAPEAAGRSFAEAASARRPATSVFSLGGNRSFRLTITPTLDQAGDVLSLIALTREITGEVQQEQRINAIHKAGEELADLTPEELSKLDVAERTDLLKYNIEQHMRGLLGLDVIEIRLLDRSTGRLAPLLTEGMTAEAAGRELFAGETGQGVTGYVAATGQSYLCRDTASDPRYIEGAEGARSSLTIPLVHHGTIIGTLNVESPKPDAFDEKDRRFIEIYGRNIAAALNTLELLEAEKASTATASMEAISRELALPLDDILNDATTALDRYAGHDEDIVNRLRHLLVRAREIRGLIRHAGATVMPGRQPEPSPPTLFGGARMLVVDADELIRQSAHHLLGRLGANVETARDANEAIAMARQTPYAVALADIRLPDLNGYEIFSKLREIQPGCTVILMTGFGYDPTHSIPNARKEGLTFVVYKPFRVEHLTETVEQAIRGGSTAAPPPRSAS